LILPSRAFSKAPPANAASFATSKTFDITAFC
jgi:hypothetical protein